MLELGFRNLKAMNCYRKIKDNEFLRLVLLFRLLQASHFEGVFLLV